LSTATANKKSNWSKAGAALVAMVTIVSGAIVIKDYFDHRPTYNLSGRWTIENTVEHTTYSPYLQMRTTFTVAFTQNGNEFSGVGEKSTISGNPVSGHDHTPLKIRGTLDGDRIHATFTEEGVKRETSGAFDWVVSNQGSRWVGTFYSTAAETSGPSVLRR
jgi:hypothetical protein